MTDSYRGWLIHYDPPPIPIRDHDWTATGPDFDCSWEGEEDGYVSSGGQVSAKTREGLIREIDDWFEEQAATHIAGCKCRDCENLWDKIEASKQEKSA